MASIEFIAKRIAGKEKEIAKLTKKLERIKKAADSGWENNPYCYTEDDLRWTKKDLEAAEAALGDYRQQLVQANEKTNSRNVKAILDFLAMWKQNCKEWYREQFKRFLVERREWYDFDRQYIDWVNGGGWRDANGKARREEHDKRRKAFTEKWGFLSRYVLRGDKLDEAKISKELDEEANAMYDDIIERTNREVGTIRDASGLSIGEKGELNGFIIGERGTAKVNTIGAGGYNIQRFHFRTLIHKVA